jgi:hypothetical protein
MLFLDKYACDRAFQKLISARIKPTHKWVKKITPTSWTMREKKITPRKKSFIIAAFDWEIVTYELNETETIPSWGHPFVMKTVFGTFDVGEIVKIRNTLEGK